MADRRLLAIRLHAGELQPTIRTEDGFLELAPLAGSRSFVPAIVARLRSLRDLTQHLTARADDSHAPPVSAFPKAPLPFKRIRGMSSPDALRPIIPDNACILCLTAAAGTELADAYSRIPSLLLLREKKFTTRRPFTSRDCSVRLSPIAENSPLLPPVESGPCLSPSVADHPSRTSY
ncbi:hypothetical protein RIF29_48048 [Crotalaria pallida]|uniref:Uncharacterized protein n=1 Tax=Crotalaria pallida TaxID=3830 RepID=A0AAN9HJF4_CROPI